MGQVTSPPLLAIDEEAQKRTERRGLQLYLLNTFLGSVLGIFSKLAGEAGSPGWGASLRSGEQLHRARRLYSPRLTEAVNCMLDIEWLLLPCAARDGVPFFELVLVRSLTLVCCTVPMLAAGHINPFGHHEKYASYSTIVLVQCVRSSPTDSGNFCHCRQWLLVLRGVFGFLGISTW